MPRPKHVAASDLRLPDALQPGRPKGDQLREILESVATEAGPGRLMPSERFLAEHFQVARGTVRQEINRLVADGVLYRQHGTATFTAERQAAHIDMLTSFTEDMQARGVVPKTKVLHAEVESAGPRIAGRLNVPPGARVFRLERLRYVDDEPFAVERTNLSVDRFPDIELFDWETQSLHRTIEERWGVRPEWNDTAISAVLPNSHDAALLGIEATQPCLIIEGTLHDQNGGVIEAGRSLYRADRYTVFTQARRSPAT
ncbi:GntR family transcriptional regulator [Amycolatopsis tolypomycina]|uniref:Transcriptional regulator, GntR family n=1 Tax=Amycolatopsis tolypomycina TaxID=208445 RepID=A0A1H4IDK0_9PSEU|nr:GntR family transcriptional regulator [Amycolatopsis tolypomycina]SEB32013.1 transcriptional regulator, GntR family [Amycolatopsis tolypomycina]